MWKRFDRDAKECLIHATKLAVRLGSPTVGLAHIFVAIINHVRSHYEENSDLGQLYEMSVKHLERFADSINEEILEANEESSADKNVLKGGEARFSTELKSIMRDLLLNSSEKITCSVFFSSVLIVLLRGEISSQEKRDLVLSQELRMHCPEFIDDIAIMRPNGKIYRCAIAEAENMLDESDEDLIDSVSKVDNLTSKSKGKKNILEEFARELVAEAKEGHLDPVIARDEVIEDVIVKLLKYKKNNPLLIGEPGVGKTAIVDGVAQRIAEGKVPAGLLDTRIYSLDLGQLTAGTRYRGDFEERFKKALKAISEADGKIILFIDEIHTIIGTGSSEGNLDVANMLKPVLTDTRFRCIGATTQSEYTKKFEKDHALDRRFLRIVIDEPTEAKACEMLAGLSERYADFHKVIIDDEVIKVAVRLSSRYITDRCLPDKAIDLIDEAASRARLEEVVGSSKKRKSARTRKKSSQSEANGEEQPLRLTKEHIAQVISLQTGVPVTKLTESDQQRLLKIEDILHQRIVGQNEPIRLVSEAILRARAGNRDSRRPIGSFLFLGPTGVGKTELAKTLAEYLFYDENALVRIDMSEYQERWNISRLLGASPGYVGYEQAGQLDILRHKPYAVVLFDEVEKAHPDIYGTLLQIMDEGSLVDSQGRRIDFKNTIIVMTSNLGFGEMEEKSFGFRASRNEEDPETRYRIMQNKVLEATKAYFKPEFLNRLDASVVFHSLEKEHLKSIIDILLSRLNEELVYEGRAITVSEAAKERILDACDEPQYGARPLRRALRDWIETPMAKEIISGRFVENSRMRVDIDKKDESKLRFTPIKPRARKQKSSK